MSNSKEVVKKEPVMSVAKEEGDRVVGEFYRTIANALGSKMELTPEQDKLVVDYWLYAKQALNTLEADRVAKNQHSKTPIKFANVDMNKFFLDVLQRVRLGINPFITASIYCIPYFNNAKGKYDLDLRIGYKGQIASTKRLSLNPIKNIRFDIVYEGEELIIHQRTPDKPIEWYEIEGRDPMDPDRKVKGAVGYIEYEDRDLNEVVTIHKGDIDKAKNFAQSDKFWSKHYESMVYKTIAHRTCSKVDLDPKLVTDSVSTLLDEENPFIPAEEKKKSVPDPQDYSNPVDFDEEEYPDTYQDAFEAPEPNMEAKYQEAEPETAPEPVKNVSEAKEEQDLPFE